MSGTASQGTPPGRTRVCRIATRGTPLARWQATHVARLIAAAEPGLAVELVVVETTGDRRQDKPVWELAGQGVFVKEVQSAVLDGRADLAVHSAKDLPSVTAPGLALAAVPSRGDVRDALVGASLAALPDGGIVATGSVRRRAQLARLRPDLRFVSLRGSIATRLSRCPPGGALLMAAVAIERLKLTPGVPVEVLDPAVMLPQVGQGALAVECRAEDDVLRERLVKIEDPIARGALDAERAFLARLGGGCDQPVAALGRVEDGRVDVDALVASVDGRVLLRRQASGPAKEAERVGGELGEELLRQAIEAGLLRAGTS